MWTPKNILLLALLVVTVWFVWAWVRLARKAKAEGKTEAGGGHGLYHTVVSLVMCFFDTLGIGNFATTTSAFKLRGSVPDEKIPGTLNVGYTLQTVAQALIYITIVDVDAWTLIGMIAASVAGAWLGAGVVAKWPRRKIQIGMGFALLAAATLMLRAQFAGQAENIGTLALSGGKLLMGLGGNFALGALMTLGIGLYAPCLILVSLLGMNPRTAFPIMMGSCAFLMPVGGIRFIREGSYNLPAALVMSVAGIPAVLIAAYIVRELTLTQVRWLVIVVVVYTAAMMLRSAIKERRAAAVRPGSAMP